MCVFIVMLFDLCVRAFFFFKQKTAYEMRISDWSSACALPISLVGGSSPPYFGCSRPSKSLARVCCASAQRASSALRYFSTCWSMAQFMNIARILGAGPLMVIDTLVLGAHRRKPGEGFFMRSEEHTSELQSIMRSSSAVFSMQKI